MIREVDDAECCNLLVSDDDDVDDADDVDDDDDDDDDDVWLLSLRDEATRNEWNNAEVNLLCTIESSLRSSRRCSRCRFSFSLSINR
jgi:hypothetical protein